MNRKSLPAKNIDQYEELYPTFIDGELHHFVYNYGVFADGESLYHFVDERTEPELFKKFVRLYFQRNNQYNPINNQINDKAIQKS